MTFNEVVEKWSKSHRNVLNTVLPYVENTPQTVLFPKELSRRLVTDQIFADFGYIPIRTITKEGKKVKKYVKKEITK